MKMLELFPPMPTLPRGSLGITIDTTSRLRELRESLEATCPEVIQTPEGLALRPVAVRSNSAK